MKYRNFLMVLVLFTACSDASVQEELAKTQRELTTAKSEIEQLKMEIEPEGELVHIVFFKVKPGVDEAALTAEVKKLEAIKEVKDLEVGPFQDLGDARALSDYSMVMEMSFDNLEAYERYQVHPIHQALKENTKTFMAGPPATYDYMKK